MLLLLVYLRRPDIVVLWSRLVAVARWVDAHRPLRDSTHTTALLWTACYPAKQRRIDIH